jgi:uncharacterized protein (DUF2235 family)
MPSDVVSSSAPLPVFEPGSNEADRCPRQLLVFCDGTNNTLNGGKRDTHVLKLAQGIKENNFSDHRQIVWYDPGVGASVNLPEATLWNQFKGHLQRLWGLAFGDGVYENIEQAIAFLARNYQEGDQIFLFGFSRGAFTARAVGGVLNQYGLPQPDHLHLLPLLIQRYFSAPNVNSRQDQAIVEQARSMTGARKPFIHFVGVWDTVDEVGFPFPGLARRIRNSNTLADKCFVHVRHVVALDEHRRVFRPRLYQHSSGGSHTARVEGATRCGSLKQVAMPGCHSDIGGGYEAHGLGDLSLAWMLQEATAPGVDLRVGRFRAIASAGAPSTLMLAHSELHTNFAWALLGQSVRDAGGALTAMDLPAQAPASPIPTVWHRWSWPRVLWWAFALVLVGASFHGLKEIGAHFDVPLWQLTAGFVGNLRPPVEAEQISRHLRFDLVFMLALALLLSLSNSAGFAHLAGQRRLGQVPQRWLNAMGMALPAYIVADLLENGLTAWLLRLLSDGSGIACAVAFLMSLASSAKFLAVAAAACLAIAGLVSGFAVWVRRLK